MKKVLGVYSAPGGHWVGDGFPVRSLFSYGSEHQRHLSPFLLLDYAGPATFDAATKPRGVGEHPHRGFETVTIVYDGELEHRDSTGAGGKIGPGDVQWMTAASGILHEEFHSKAFTKTGGKFEVVQLWVNLPAKDKMAAPGYQTLLKKDIPVVTLPDGAGTLRVISGDHAGVKGPAKTFTPMNVWDLKIKQGGKATLDIDDGRTATLIVMRGKVTINGNTSAGDTQMVLLGRGDSGITLEASTDAALLLLSGETIDEPVVGYGPFVMNTEAEIRQAVDDYRNGKFGRMAAA
jgi:redox-sensitive bicupin YhaK (pirin superfamily)